MIVKKEKLNQLIFGNSCGSKMKKKCHLNRALKDGEMFFWRKSISSSGRSIYKKRERERDVQNMEQLAAAFQILPSDMFCLVYT